MTPRWMMGCLMDPEETGGNTLPSLDEMFSDDPPDTNQPAAPTAPAAPANPKPPAETDGGQEDPDAGGTANEPAADENKGATAAPILTPEDLDRAQRFGIGKDVLDQFETRAEFERAMRLLQSSLIADGQRPPNPAALPKKPDDKPPAATVETPPDKPVEAPPQTPEEIQRLYKPYEPKLGEEIAPEIQRELKALADHTFAQLRLLAGGVNELRTKDVKAENARYDDLFDGYIGGLSEHYKEFVGEKSDWKTKPETESGKVQYAIAEAAANALRGAKARGIRMTDQEAFETGLHAVLKDKIKLIAEKELLSKAKPRTSVMSHRPQRNSGKAASATERAIQSVGDRMRAANIPNNDEDAALAGIDLDGFFG